jgi:CubicO group peptidase (beta-lactamase class C family)
VIVGAVSGQSYEQYVSDHIFTPLEMQNSFMYRDEAKQHGMATGYTYLFGAPTAIEISDLRGDMAAAGVIASAEDMGHYLIALLNAGRYRDENQISDKAGETARITAWAGGCGWDLSALLHEHNGRRQLSPSMALMPGDYGIVVLVNDHGSLCRSIDRSVGGDQPLLVGLPSRA